MNYRLRLWLALALLRASHSLPAGYVTWQLFRWSLQAAPHVTEAERSAALTMWDEQGARWGFCRWPREEVR